MNLTAINLLFVLIFILSVCGGSDSGKKANVPSLVVSQEASASQNDQTKNAGNSGCSVESLGKPPSIDTANVGSNLPDSHCQE